VFDRRASFASDAFALDTCREYPQLSRLLLYMPATGIIFGTSIREMEKAATRALRAMDALIVQD